MLKNFAHLQQRLPKIPNINVNLRKPVKLTVISVTLGLALIGFLSAYFRRRKNQKKFPEKVKAQLKLQAKYNLPKTFSNGDVHGRNIHVLGASPLETLLRKQKSLSGSLSSLGGVSTTSTITHSGVDMGSMTPLQLCQLGMERLSGAVSLWEDAIMRLSYLDDQPYLAIPDPDTAALQHRLERLLDMGYKMQDNYERQCERHADHFALETALSAFTEANMALRERQRSLDGDSGSDQDSFVSATDMANLSDLENHRELFHYLPLYEAGLMELKYGNITCRTLRTEMTQCLSDTEFLAKLHCLRLASDELFRDDTTRDWFIEMGRTIIGDLLKQCDKDPEDFYLNYDKTIEFIKDPVNSWKIEDELKGRGVKLMTYYDIVLDFIMMDAFDDLEGPPSTVTAVVQNRWLSNGFKETALSTAIWSVLKAKRRMLKFSDGFIGHLYSISEHVSPLLAWGFLGPESELKTSCYVFKDLVLGYIQDLFSFDKARYTTVEDLAADILSIAKQTSEVAAEQLSS
ncbi:mitoguardin isoform X1 [Patella vulgata]|uniref:mitoguardin isoform X1 n=3 Tax=Patella vulgata TaxID=6465 RepID=UPI00217F8B64|nr:mitoguardin isoform X1 [Patella vulgata]XP_050416678.1 mitoguardin isoform X1 [Patella vulgata]XP_050416683.1 mitoguardin isoform X1 [Patella vulgata]